MECPNGLACDIHVTSFGSGSMLCGSLTSVYNIPTFEVCLSYFHHSPPLPLLRNFTFRSNIFFFLDRKDDLSDRT